MPKQRDYPPNTQPTAIRLSVRETAILARVRKLHPYLKGMASAINLTIHFWDLHNPDTEQPEQEAEQQEVD
jgi:hypothetical protein